MISWLMTLEKHAMVNDWVYAHRPATWEVKFHAESRQIKHLLECDSNKHAREYFQVLAVSCVSTARIACQGH